MIKTMALGSIYLLMLFAFAAGIESLSENECSDWLASCPDEVAVVRSSAKDSRPDLVSDTEHR